ncbi:FAD-dependent oxidoreductase [Lichenicoccus roseus]|uniref:FAD-dependent oxidoreductase n=1 Tax=Lichenicoccus roseus TaxID=2683649 RepID=A0A5R9JBR4_9PROT|nr:FAD-dependent oxidoreductase [Lichenicoccus roseus]TLU73977.1 FAD-dependent oxidoreductase [Lichenicoccus roseus]
MVSRIAIIGAGWYGCHIGTSLKLLGFDVTVFEQHARPLHEASGNNQFRLHLGFHYPRHHQTRVQSRDGFMRFMERYPYLSREVTENIYAVPSLESLIDFATYRLIMTSSGIEYREVGGCSVPIAGVAGLIRTGERVLLIEQARRYFIAQLAGSLVLGHHVGSIEHEPGCVRVEGQPFDLLVNASWGQQDGLPPGFFYEPTMLLYYETDRPFPAVTLVDGPLCSVYPTEDPSIYTLSSVPHTPLGHATDPARARHLRDSVTAETVDARRCAMEAQIARYLPDFEESFRFVGPQLSIKTKPVGSFDDRSCSVIRRGRVFHVMSGKIDTIFFAMERILSFLEASQSPAVAPLQSPLRQDILDRGLVTHAV